MDFADNPAEAEFRAGLRRWLAEHPTGPLPTDPDERMAARHEWHRALYAAGLVGLSFPVEFGGQGKPPTFEAILNDELGLVGAPPPPNSAHLSYAIAEFGDDEQKRTHLPGLLSCEVLWCQGFSEPGAGSDLAAVSTRGELTTSADGRPVYRLDGQKIWTSEAAWATWCMALVRTEPDRRAHRGLSMLLLPLDTPGLEVRTIVTASGTREFAEVFFDGAEVDAAGLLGEPGQGWAIAMHLLGYERGPADVGWVARLARVLTLLEGDVRSGRIEATATQRAEIARAWVELRALQVHVQRTLSSRLDGSTPGPEGSIDKLLMTRAEQGLVHADTDVRGAATLVGDHAMLDGYFWSRAQAIFGGTQQIQRNLVAQRVLGLPRS